MTSAVAPSIPYYQQQHSTTLSSSTTTTTTFTTLTSQQPPRSTRNGPPRAIPCALPDVTTNGHHHHHHAAGSSPSSPITTLTSSSNSSIHGGTITLKRSPSIPTIRCLSPTDKVESHQRFAPVAAAKSKTHSRLASFGRHRLRGILPTTGSDLSVQGEALPCVPVSPSDTSSHKHSDVSSRSNTSSETTLTDDAKSDIKSIGENRRPSAYDAATWLDREKQYDSYRDLDEYEKLLRRSPRMMHQTSSKLLRMTGDDRPFTRDFKDLFSTLMVSLPLTSHRVRFSRIDHTFTTEEATTNLGSLKFSQSNRMPDPKDPSRIVTTTTTTTFSMAKEMARSVCQRFLEARFIESVDGKTDFLSRGSVWQLTPKGMHILTRFCQRNGIHQRHVNELLESPRNMMQLVILERDPVTDKIQSDPPTMNVIFRRFAGDTGPNLKSASTSSDSDSMSDYATGMVGVKMHRAKRGDKDSPYVFSGKSAFDWLMDCCTTVDKREAYEIAHEFLKNELIELFVGDERPNGQVSVVPRFSASKQILYAVTSKGMRTAGWVTSPNGTVNGAATASQRVPQGVVRDSNTNRMTVIIRDPALRLLFREYLRETHCEENLAFYVEVQAFLSEYERAKRGSPVPRPDTIRETLASAYSLYNAFLAPGSPCELNIDHNLRNALAGRMTKAVGEDEQMVKSLDEVAALFDQAQNSVFKLMASDSVPKFSREPKYATILRERNMESMLADSSKS